MAGLADTAPATAYMVDLLAGAGPAHPVRLTELDRLLLLVVAGLADRDLFSPAGFSSITTGEAADAAGMDEVMARARLARLAEAGLLADVGDGPGRRWRPLDAVYGA